MLAERLLRQQVPSVASTGRRTGRGELDEHAEGVHNSEIEVDLAPSERPREVVLADLRQRLAVLPASVSLGQPISHRLDHMLSGVRAQIALKIFGDDLDEIQRVSQEIAEVLRDLSVLRGTKDLSFGERRMLETARALVDAGIGAADRSLALVERLLVPTA